MWPPSPTCARLRFGDDKHDDDSDDEAAAPAQREARWRRGWLWQWAIGPTAVAHGMVGGEGANTMRECHECGAAAPLAAPMRGAGTAGQGAIKDGAEEAAHSDGQERSAGTGCVRIIMADGADAEAENGLPPNRDDAHPRSTPKPWLLPASALPRASHSVGLVLVAELRPLPAAGCMAGGGG